MNDFDYLAQLPGEERELGWMRERLETLSIREGIALASAVQRESPGSAADAINLIQSLDAYGIVYGADSYERLGEYYLGNCGGAPDDVRPYIDLAEIGKHYASLCPGQFSEGHYIAYPDVTIPPAYQGQGAPLPEDAGWAVKLKAASPIVPEGVWLRLPWEDGLGDYTGTEEDVALHALHAQSWAECTLLDAQCVLPEAGDLAAQYSGNVSDLLYDGVELGLVLAQKGQGSPHFMERYAAALALEGCQSLKLALDISQNLNCYDWMQRADLEESGRCKLLDAGVTEEQIRASGVDLAGYRAHLLEQEGYTPTANAHVW